MELDLRVGPRRSITVVAELARAIGIGSMVLLLALDAAGAQVNDGKGIAAFACAACHQVNRQGRAPSPTLDDDNKSTGIAPSFLVIAAEYQGDAAGLRGILRHAHYPRPEPQVENAELDAVVAYILSLRRPTSVQR